VTPPSPIGKLLGMRLLLLLPLLLIGCDNSGGPPPDGAEVAIESVGWGFVEPCFGGDDLGAMLLDVEDVNEWMEPCGAPNQAKQQQIVNKIGELDDTRRLVAARIVLGGCVQDWWLRGLYQDGAVINIWVMKEDTSHNVTNAACTDDIGWAEGYWIAAEGDVANSTAATLISGSFNPDHAGAPLAPGG